MGEKLSIFIDDIIVLTVDRQPYISEKITEAFGKVESGVKYGVFGVQLGSDDDGLVSKLSEFKMDNACFMLGVANPKLDPRKDFVDFEFVYTIKDTGGLRNLASQVYRDLLRDNQVYAPVGPNSPHNSVKLAVVPEIKNLLEVAGVDNYKITVVIPEREFD